MRIPIATYRLQIQPDFPFSAVPGILDYLKTLGISDLYAAPVFHARKGSAHGYDIVDPRALSPMLGGAAEFDKLMQAVQERDMGWLQDVVPNHMAFSSENTLLMDVFENGPESPYLEFFDVNWDHPYEGLRGRILTPFLGRFYGECLKDREIQIVYENGSFQVAYYDNRYPLRIASYSEILARSQNRLETRLGATHPAFLEYLGLREEFTVLPGKDRLSERREQVRMAKDRLWALYRENEAVKNCLDGNLRELNGENTDPDPLGALDQLLTNQYFRLSFWKVPSEETNYRRFFTISDLICVNIENENVFRETHCLIRDMVAKKYFTGLRIDHIDGLRNPRQYLDRLHQTMGPLYTVVEKILESGEEMPAGWPVQGTTGYEFLVRTQELFCRRQNQRKMSRIYAQFSGVAASFSGLAAEKKRLIIGKHMAGNIDNLALLLKKISSQDRIGRDITLYGLRRALVEVMVYFPVYRTYLDRNTFSKEDRQVIREAIHCALQNNPGLMYEIRFIEKFFLFHEMETLNLDDRAAWSEFVMQFQQYTGPLMAKGLEDTAFYCYNRLLALNEVGGDPGRFGVTVKEFHEWNRKRRKRFANAMNTTATHDTKRGEDMRARLLVLSEIPEEWGKRIRHWSQLNHLRTKTVHGLTVPDPNDEYFLYQTLLGMYPLDPREREGVPERLKAYVVKAVREAKVHTTWLKPDSDYEEAYTAFVEEILKPAVNSPFLDDFHKFHRRLAFYGVFNSLSQVLLKITAPGLPDFYQGTELWDFSLVDPDNRRPVDYERRRNILETFRKTTPGETEGLLAELLADPADGRIKLYVTHRALELRNRHRELFEKGEYTPLKMEGRYRENIVAFAREYQGQFTLTLCPRFLTQVVQGETLPLGDVWKDTRVVLPSRFAEKMKDAFTGEVCKSEGGKLMLSEALQHFPLGFLEG